MALNLGLAIGLSFSFGFLAAAIGTTISSWAMLILLWRGSKHMGSAVALDKRLKSRLPYILLASIGMGLTIYIIQYSLDEALNTPKIRYIALFALVTSGIFSYTVFLKLFGIISFRDIKILSRRR